MFRHYRKAIALKDEWAVTNRTILPEQAAICQQKCPSSAGSVLNHPAIPAFITKYRTLRFLNMD